MPTATHMLADAQDTPANDGAPVPRFVQSPSSGVGRTVHLAPFQRSTSDSHPSEPTAKHERMEGQDTASSRTPPNAAGRGLAVRWRRQLLPSQRSASVPPTAVHALAVAHETSVNGRDCNSLVQAP